MCEFVVSNIKNTIDFFLMVYKVHIASIIIGFNIAWFAG